MAINKNALIRYKTIDYCLQNTYRKWTLEDLINACCDALYEFEGIDGVSKRTVQADIQILRSNKLGYNAPIIVKDKKYYSYENPNYSITNIPLSDKDLNKLSEAVEFLKQFQGFSHFNDLSGMVQKLEDQIYSQKTKTSPVIDFEKNDNLKGLKFLDFLYKSIINKTAIEITYKSFKARSENTFVFHPYLLKEFNNRWFIIGRKNDGKTILNLAIDRIIEVSKANNQLFKSDENFDAETFYKNAIGVSVTEGMEIEKVILFATHIHAPYILTKPLHWSQKEIERSYYGVKISLEVQHNYELEKKILGFGEGVKVLEPEKLKKNIEKRLKNAVEFYDTDISIKGLMINNQKLKHNGFNVLKKVFTKSNLIKIDAIIYNFLKIEKIETDNFYELCDLFSNIKKIEKLIYSITFIKLLESISPNLKLLNTSYVNCKNAFKKEWVQNDRTINIFIPLTDIFDSFGGVKFFPGTHKKTLENSKIEVIHENNIPYTVVIPKMSILIYNAKLMHQFYKVNSNQRLRYILLEYTL